MKKDIDFAIECMDSLAPSCKQLQPLSYLRSTYSHPDLAGILPQILEKKYDSLWNELGILMLRSALVLPAITWQEVARKILQGDISFFGVDRLFPDVAEKILTEEQKQHIFLPEKVSDTVDRAQAQRWIESNYARSRSLDWNSIAQVWDKGSTSDKEKLLTWILKLSNPGAVSLPEFKSRSKGIKIKLAMLNARLNGSYIESKTQELIERVWDQNLDFETWSWISPRTVLTNSNKHLELGSLSDSVYLHLIESALLHQDAQMAIKLFMTREHLLQRDFLCQAYLQPKTLEHWIFHLIRMQKASGWILGTLQLSSTYWTPSMSDNLISWTLSHWLSQPALTSVIQQAAWKADPSILQTLVHFKERNAYLDPTYGKVLNQTIKGLQLRLSIRRCIQRGKA